MKLLIQYDLHAPDQNYEDLEIAIKALSPKGHALRVLLSTWLVSNPDLTDEMAISVLKPLLDADDKLIVVDVTDRTFYNHGLTPGMSRLLEAVMELS